MVNFKQEEAMTAAAAVREKLAAEKLAK